MYKDILGIVGGFGAYATMDFYKKFLERFSTGSERDYPHIIMDNNFTMPSRTLALLNGDNQEEIVYEISKSLKLLHNAGCNKIVLVCGTAHYFLEECYKIVPEVKNDVLDIIYCTCKHLKAKNITKVNLIAAEGSLSTDLFDNYFNKYEIDFLKPAKSDFSQIRTFIEGVKQNKINNKLIFDFYIFLKNLCKKNSSNFVLGCTEFPVLVDYILNNPNCLTEKAFEDFSTFHFIDPVEICIEMLYDVLE